MIKRYTLFGVPFLTVYVGNSSYPKSTILYESIEDNIKVVKQEADDGDINEARYSLIRGDKRLAFIRGYFEDSKSFHMGIVENATGDNVSGFRYLSLVYHIMENDLRMNGIEKITTMSLAKLAPIALRRYGFKDTNGKGYDTLKKSWLRFIPGKCVSLEKRLGALTAN